MLLFVKADTKLVFLSVAPCIGQLKSKDVTEVLFKPRSKCHGKFHIARIVIYPGEVDVLVEKVSSLIIESRPRQIFLLITFIF